MQRLRNLSDIKILIDTTVKVSGYKAKFLTGTSNVGEMIFDGVNYDFIPKTKIINELDSSGNVLMDADGNPVTKEVPDYTGLGKLLEQVIKLSDL